MKPMVATSWALIVGKLTKSWAGSPKTVGAEGRSDAPLKQAGSVARAFKIELLNRSSRSKPFGGGIALVRPIF